MEQYQMEESLQKVGFFVRTTFLKIFAERKINVNEINKLLTEEYSKQCFGLRFPILKKIDDSKHLLEQKQVNGHIRYWNTVISFENDKYIICKEWREHNRIRFMKWFEKYKENGTYTSQAPNL
jgi:hypothetical protein